MLRLYNFIMKIVNIFTLAGMKNSIFEKFGSLNVKSILMHHKNLITRSNPKVLVKRKYINIYYF